MINCRFIKEKYKDFISYNSEKLNSGIIMNANESPYEFPKKLKNKFKKMINSMTLNRYPDSDCIMLRNAIANNYKLDIKNVAVGVGSDDLIDIILKSTIENNKLLILTPTFSMYQIYNKLNGGDVTYVKPSDDMQFDYREIIRAIKERNPLVTFICNPNNPTGQCFTVSQIEEVLKSTTNLVIVDEAYAEYSDVTAIPLLHKYDNLAILRTFSKAYCLASIRLGYVLSNINFIEMIESIKSPYRVSSINSLLGKLVMENTNMFRENIENVKMQTLFLYNELSKIKNITVYKTKANFIFFKTENGLYKHLLSKGISVRKFIIDNKIYIRVSCGTKEDNKKFLKEVGDYYERSK